MWGVGNKIPANWSILTLVKTGGSHFSTTDTADGHYQS